MWPRYCWTTHSCLLESIWTTADERVNQGGVPSSAATSVYLEKSDTNEPNQGRYVQKSIRVGIESGEERAGLFLQFLRDFCHQTGLEFGKNAVHNARKLRALRVGIGGLIVFRRLRGNACLSNFRDRLSDSALRAHHRIAYVLPVFPGRGRLRGNRRLGFSFRSRDGHGVRRRCRGGCGECCALCLLGVGHWRFG